jgi:SOS-response transcriptional repressor LexA
MRSLTPRQAEVLRALYDLTFDLGFPPTIRELGAVIGGQPNGVLGHLRALERKGKIWRGTGARAIRLLVSTDPPVRRVRR